MKRRYPIVGAALVGLVVGGWLAAPYAVKAYAEHTHPDIKIERVTKIRPDRVECEGVTVNKGWIQGRLDRVIVYRDKSVGIIGGSLTYRRDKAPKGEGGEAAKITVSGLRELLVMGGDYGALFEGVNYIGGVLCFDKADAQHPRGMVTITKGCVDKAKREAWAEKVSANIKLPLDIPEFPNEGTAEAQGAYVWFGNEPAASLRRLSYGPVTASVVSVTRKGAQTHLIAGEVVLSHPWLGTGPLTLPSGVEATVDDDSLTQTLHPIKATINGIPLSIFVKERAVETLSTRCDDWVKGLPTELQGPFEGIRWKEVPGRSNGLHAWIMAGGPKPEFHMWHTCKADCTSPALKALRGRFKYRIYTSKDERVERESGPGSREWAFLPDMHPSLTTAVETCEDPGFRLHQGYIAQAFENSLRDDLKHGRFMRGGSTITMQLAKNLWLYRDKTITRKLQEVLLAIALESCFSKQEIMELYLNVVEFGPDLYGIGPATQRYFKSAPSALTPEQSFWLAMLLPRPRKAGLPNEAAMDRVKGFMKLLVKNNRLDETMLAPEAPVGSDAEWGQ